MEEQKRKIKILLLGTHDSKLAGHVGAIFEKLPSEYDKRMVTLESWYKPQPYAFWNKGTKRYRLYCKIKRIYYYYRRKLRYGEPVIIDTTKKEYCFHSFEDECYNAKKILSKCSGFNPDVISIYWSAKFVSSKTIRDLYENTKARIVIHFVDQAPMTGGCHYFCDCNRLFSGCKNCPALLKGNKLAQDQMHDKIMNLRNVPITIVGVPYDLSIARQTPLYKTADCIEVVSKPDVIEFSRANARCLFNIGNNEYVIFVGASDLSDKRKGLKYSLDAINKFAEDKTNITVLMLGRNQDNFSFNKNVKTIQPGFLNKDNLCAAFCASDVFISSTIADSGPMMVNYAFALGIPVISFNIGVAYTLVKHLETGYMASFKSSDSISKGLDYIYNLNEVSRLTMSNKMKERLDKLSSKGTWYNRLIEIVRNDSKDIN